MTKILCDITGCKYNNSCCSSPSEDKNDKCYCTKELVQFKVDDSMCSMTCEDFEENIEKDIECSDCQINKYGGIKLHPYIEFEEYDIKNYKF